MVIGGAVKEGVDCTILTNRFFSQKEGNGGVGQNMAVLLFLMTTKVLNYPFVGLRQIRTFCWVFKIIGNAIFTQVRETPLVYELERVEESH